MTPKHINTVPEFIKDDKGKDIPRRAVAPYNFVELPNKVVEAEQPLPSGNRYHLDRHTGKIECTLITESPLYIRGGMSPADFARYSEFVKKEPPQNMTKEQKRLWERKEKEREQKWEKDRQDILAPFFTYSSDALPVLPGSSLRGMLRTLVEIVSFSKIERVADNQRLFFRAVGSNPKKESWGKEYKQYVAPKKIQAGYIKKDNQGWYIQPAQIIEDETFAWVRQVDLELSDLKKFDDDGYKPQYIDVSYQTLEWNEERNNKGKLIAKRLFAQNIDSPNRYPGNQGVLVTSGNMKQGDESSLPSPRRNHCVVFAPDIKSPKLRLDHKAIEHYRNALTDVQKQSPFDKEWGILQENKKRPVFYSPPQTGNVVGFFGQSPNFRIPYSPDGNGQATTVVDFIPPNLRKLVLIDLADAIFGWVKQESDNEKLPKEKKQRASRVLITDAILEKKYEEKAKQSQQRQAQKILLSSPKPTTFQHYLVQPKADNSQLKHYANKPPTETAQGETVIRGHKLYWHKPCVKIEVPENADTQTNLIQPIEPELLFTFDIHFENLSKVELGGLLWVLSLSSDRAQKLGIGKKDDQTGKDEQYCLSLGMGKPLGMGAVKIEPTLYLSDRPSRYSNLFNVNGDTWTTGEENQSKTAKEESESVKAFEKYVLDWICCQDYPKDKSREQLQHLKELPRIEMLLAMLRCDKTPDSDKTRYMEIGCDPSQKQCIGKPKNDGKVNEYVERPVLPTPLDVMGLPDKRRLDNSAPYPSTGGIRSSSGNAPKPILKGQDKGKPIKKSQQPQQQKKPKDNSGGSNSVAWARPPKPKN